MARFRSGDEFREVVRGEDRHAYVDAQRELLAAGWTRVHDPAREQEFPERPRDAALEAAIDADPDDDQAWLVYADFLIERGDPRGPLVALEAAPVRNLVERAARDAESRRLRQAAAGELGQGLVGRPGLHVRWRRGFLHAAQLRGAFLLGDAEDLLFDLLRHPCARFLRDLELALWHTDAQDHRLLTALLARAPLRRLVIRYPDTAWTGYPPLGDLGALRPTIEHLDLAGDDTTRFTGLALPRCRSFAFETVGLAPHALRAIAAAPWRALEHLDLALRGTTCTLADLRFVLALPRLARLRLRAVPFANELVAALIASPLAPRLALLDLRGSPLDDDAAGLLRAARDRFPADFALELRGTAVTAAMRDELEAADIDLGT